MKSDMTRIAPGKSEYARGKRPAVDCILCAIRDGDPQVADLKVFAAEGFYVTVNLYPFNPGHVMIVPERHVEHLLELSEEEALRLHRLQVLTLKVLEEVYQPGGFNVGYNVGPASGASIAHLHLQMVPRYPSEVGFFDVFSNARAIGEAPQETMRRLKDAFSRLARLP